MASSKLWHLVSDLIKGCLTKYASRFIMEASLLVMMAATAL